MARFTSKLTALTVAKTKKPGLYNDGAGLYLKVGPTGGKSWVFRYKLNKQQHLMGLGPVSLVTLQEARDMTLTYRKALLRGEDPLENRRRQRAKSNLERSRSMTFDQCFESFFESKRHEWKNEKHAAQWKATIETYVSPTIGGLAIQDVTIDLVIKVLNPIWTEIPETASRVRSRIENVLDWATVSGFRQGDNPARWKGCLDKILPKRSKIAPKKNFASLSYLEIGAFMAELRKHSGISHKALEFTILTAARTGEALGATWDEMDLEQGVWTVPAERMKAGKPHRVPLSNRLIDILKSLPRIEGCPYVFPGLKGRGQMSNTALLKVIKVEMNMTVTTHGFRSTFSTWAREKTNHPRDVVEMALAHTIENSVEAAYMRGDLYLKRKALMDQWAKYCDSPSVNSSKIFNISSTKPA